MAGTTGLEPATSAVTGQRSNQLSYVPSAISRLPQIADFKVSLTVLPRVSPIFSAGYNQIPGLMDSIDTKAQMTCPLEGEGKPRSCHHSAVQIVPNKSGPQVVRFCANGERSEDHTDRSFRSDRRR
jgi:hypothetical protein